MDFEITSDGHEAKCVGKLVWVATSPGLLCAALFVVRHHPAAFFFFADVVAALGMVRPLDVTRGAVRMRVYIDPAYGPAWP